MYIELLEALEKPLVALKQLKKNIEHFSMMKVLGNVVKIVKHLAWGPTKVNCLFNIGGEFQLKPESIKNGL